MRCWMCTRKIGRAFEKKPNGCRIRSARSQVARPLVVLASSSFAIFQFPRISRIVLLRCVYPSPTHALSLPLSHSIHVTVCRSCDVEAETETKWESLRVYSPHLSRLTITTSKSFAVTILPSIRAISISALKCLAASKLPISDRRVYPKF